MDGCMAGWWRWQIRPEQVLMIRVVLRRCDRRSAWLGQSHSPPPTPPAAAFLAAAFTPPAGRLRRGTPVCSLCEALLNGQHPAGHPSLPLMASALRRKSTGPQRRAENNDREVNRRTVAPRSRASCMHLPYARIPLSGALVFPGHFFFHVPRTDGRDTTCVQFAILHTPTTPGKTSSEIGRKSSTQKTEKLGGTGQAAGLLTLLLARFFSTNLVKLKMASSAGFVLVQQYRWCLRFF